MRADTANDEWDTMPNDNDDVDEAAEYEAWKIRELQRVKRDFDELAATEAEKVERQRRRGLTEEQILAEDKDAFKNTKKGMKGTQWKYLQKYYHRGAFFQVRRSSNLAHPPARLPALHARARSDCIILACAGRGGARARHSHRAGIGNGSAVLSSRAPVLVSATVAGRGGGRHGGAAVPTRLRRRDARGQLRQEGRPRPSL